MRTLCSTVWLTSSKRGWIIDSSWAIRTDKRAACWGSKLLACEDDFKWGECVLKSIKNIYGRWDGSFTEWLYMKLFILLFNPD